MDQTPDEIIQQEIMRERAEALTRAGNRVDEALGRLRALAEHIECLKRELSHLPPDSPHMRQHLVNTINESIRHYNELRKHADLRYYYLIVTREALGLRHHQRVAEIYAIPPRMKLIKDHL
ncbi:MAG TPA: hypothetical protein PLT64_02030 [Syntrophales bacterium]|nr:hypothetical protein [Syntrophales bacterium]HOL58628.1 hypothetical protein [Syntrophales bacterium]HPO35084.1 hypothetical protein [Syntrophales bacterium]